MNNFADKTPHLGSFSYHWGKRLFSLLLAFLLVFEVFPLQAFAAWDGSGDVSGSAGDVSGKYWVYDGSSKDIVGYRFSVYDADGNKAAISCVFL